MGKIAKSKNEGKKKDRKLVWALVMTAIAVLLLLSFYSYLTNWKSDQSVPFFSGLFNRSIHTNNILSVLGDALGYFFIYKGVGVAAFIFPLFLLALVVRFFALKKFDFIDTSFKLTMLILYVSVSCAFFSSEESIYGGMIGYEISDFIQSILGGFGLGFLLFLLLLIYIVNVFHITLNDVKNWVEKISAKTNVFISEVKKNIEKYQQKKSSEKVENQLQPDEKFNFETEIEAEIEPISLLVETPQKPVDVFTHREDIPPLKEDFEVIETPEEKEEISLEITPENGEETAEEVARKLVEDFGEYDPTLELKNFQNPPLDLLIDYKSGVVRDDNELNENKNTIIQTLGYYKIEIKKITATIGPTVTLYEIVPADGIRISKIKNLEDDIAMSLAALGIRIIAPIPGKGTVGIEVPNKKPSVVSMRSVIGSQRFQSAEMELPIAFGKTITNETFVVDLAKMPHLLMAGATGQGKSVGLNAVITSLLYRKHPAEVKFVLVDPKKVELSLYNKIERHYLAKLPDSQEAIITDNTKVINTLNSLCIEMDNRYQLLQHAQVRNIKEYNAKFKNRLLNPNDGHQFLPYIVLIVDEFADLIMTAGKEVEMPIARLAQLARAVGIHLIIATQRPSVNVITGLIKANFPARVAFKVAQKIDSKTILDGSGADRLIGRGDMLYTQGNDMVRIQCAFVDTPEIDKIVGFIGEQKAYPDAYLLPEYVGEGSSAEPLEDDVSKRDALFREAAEVVVTTQQGSASTLQRKLNIGFARAGRIIDQLEAAGIVGPFEGSKPRKVLITDLIALEFFFQNKG